MSDLVKALPQPPAKPVEEWTLGELTLDNAREGMLFARKLLDAAKRLELSAEGLNDRGAALLAKLGKEVAIDSAKLLERVEEAALKRQAGDDAKWDATLRKLAELKAKGKKNQAPIVLDGADEKKSPEA